MQSLNAALTILVIAVASINLCSATITYVVPNEPLPGIVAPPGAPWPQPRSVLSTYLLYTLDPANFQLTSNLVGCDVIDFNLDQYRSYIFIDSAKGKADPTKQALTGLTITVNGSCEEYITLYADESYNLDVTNGDSGVAQATSATIWGALRALETFSELVWQEDDGSYCINASSIEDFPRFTHRGVLLDSARHFLPVSILKKNLDAMQWNKMNAFHWHLTDDQAFTFESKIYPNVSLLGAYMPSHVYSQDDMADIIEYARLRGIRVIPEFDSPGHTKSIGKSLKGLITPCYTNGVPYTPNYPYYSDSENFDPSNDDVYTFMKNLITEARSVFKDDFVHLGMDEVSYACWESNPNIAEFMVANGLKTYSDLENYYVRRLTDLVGNIPYKFIAWQDPIDSGVNLTKEAIVHVWKDTYLDPSMKTWQEYIVPIAQQGYTMLLSSCWYLNYISYGQDWVNYYNCDPQAFNGTQEQKDLVKGGEATIWAEYVDGTNLISRLWPRASAVAERLWSDASVNNSDDASFRLDQQRCRMLRRGLPTEPILDGYCGDYEWET